MAWQGSVVNRIMENSRYPEIVVGMGATICHWSDRSPATVVAVRYAKDGRTVHEIDILGDHVGPNKRVWPDQDYDITPSSLPDTFCGNTSKEPSRCKGEKPCVYHGAEVPPVQTWRMDKRGRLRRTRINPDTGRRVLTDMGGISLGHRDYYQDPSF